MQQIEVRTRERQGFYDITPQLQALVQEKVLNRIDHTNLNDCIENPTAENIAIWIWGQLKPILPPLSEIKLFETPESSVIYRGS